MATDGTRDVEDRLADLLDGVIGWLQFAESKNTGIVGLISTALGVIVTFLLAGPSIPTLAGAGLAAGAVMLMISLLLSVASFLPATDQRVSGVTIEVPLRERRGVGIRTQHPRQPIDG